MEAQKLKEKPYDDLNLKQKIKNKNKHKLSYFGHLISTKKQKSNKVYNKLFPINLKTI